MKHFTFKPRANGPHSFTVFADTLDQARTKISDHIKTRKYYPHQHLGWFEGDYTVEEEELDKMDVLVIIN